MVVTACIGSRTLLPNLTICQTCTFAKVWLASLLSLSFSPSLGSRPYARKMIFTKAPCSTQVALKRKWQRWFVAWASSGGRPILSYPQGEKEHPCEAKKCVGKANAGPTKCNLKVSGILDDVWLPDSCVSEGFADSKLNSKPAEGNAPSIYFGHNFNLYILFYTMSKHGQILSTGCKGQEGP